MNSNIKAVVLDVDGILVGEKGGVNFPAPEAKIIKALKTINGNGIPVILCTGRPFYTPAMKTIIGEAELDNYHISDMGSLIMNPRSGGILQSKTIGPNDSRLLVRQLLEAGLVTNYFTPEEYYVQRDQADKKISMLLSDSIKALPQVVDSLEKKIIGSQTLYISGRSEKESGRIAMENILRGFRIKLDLLWGNNLFLTDGFYGFFVPSGTSKASSLEVLLDSLALPFENVLGAGDGVVDWDFMKLCGYRATLENAMPQVLENIKAGDKARNFIGPNVNQSGILEVFRYFKLIN